MSEMVDPFAGAEKMAVQAEAMKAEALRSRWTREQAVAHGEALALDTARQKGEVGVARDQRVARARAYAAWEWDKKPSGGAHLVEFGVVSPDVGTHERWFRPDPKKGKP